MDQEFIWYELQMPFRRVDHFFCVFSGLSCFYLAPEFDLCPIRVVRSKFLSTKSPPKENEEKNGGYRELSCDYDHLLS